MQIGSQAHKELYCRSFLEGHVRYEPAQLPWPELDAEALALLRGLPFWTHALQFESDAGPMIRSVARLETDPLIREALELQAYEEERHARLVRHMIDLYALPHREAHVVPNPSPIQEFVDFGFEECLDSFGAFGLFRLARDAKIVADPLFEVFDNVMREESHHIVFFINWYAHREASSGLAGRWLRGSWPGLHLREQLAIAAAIALMLAALGLELAGQRSAGLDPRASSYAAIVYAGAGIQGLLVSGVVVMGAYTIVRSLAGRLTRERHATFDCLRVLWHYTVIQGLALSALLHLAPRALG